MEKGSVRCEPQPRGLPTHSSGWGAQNRISLPVCTLRPQSYQSPGENIYPTTKEKMYSIRSPLLRLAQHNRSQYRVTACHIFPGQRPTRGLLHSGVENEMNGLSGLLRTGPKTGRASTLSTTSLHVAVRGTRHEGRFRQIQADYFDNKCASQKPRTAGSVKKIGRK